MFGKTKRTRMLERAEQETGTVSDKLTLALEGLVSSRQESVKWARSADPVDMAGIIQNMAGANFAMVEALESLVRSEIERRKSTDFTP